MDSFEYQYVAFMMEPLAGFYILLGLSFDVVGAYLLVSIIISFKSSWTPELLKIHNEWLIQYREFLPKMSQIIIADGVSLMWDLGV